MADTETDFLVIARIFPTPATAQTHVCADFTADFGGSCLNLHTYDWSEIILERTIQNPVFWSWNGCAERAVMNHKKMELSAFQFRTVADGVCAVTGLCIQAS